MIVCVGAGVAVGRGVRVGTTVAAPGWRDVAVGALGVADGIGVGDPTTSTLALICCGAFVFASSVVSCSAAGAESVNPMRAHPPNAAATEATVTAVLAMAMAASRRRRDCCRVVMVSLVERKRASLLYQLEPV